MDYNLGIGIFVGCLLIIAIISTTINHYKKKKSNQGTCVSCGGIGFIPTYTSKVIPPCKHCMGTGYVNRK